MQAHSYYNQQGNWQPQTEMVMLAIHPDHLMRIKTYLVMNNIPFSQEPESDFSSRAHMPAPAPESIPERVSRMDLSAREKEVFLELIEGKDYKSIAGRLFISVETTRTHIKAIYRKLGVKNRAEAMALLLPVAGK